MSEGKTTGAGRGDVFAGVSAPAWERPTRDAVCVATLCLPRSIPRRKSGAVPDESNSGCTGGPGHRVAGRCTVDGSNESRLAHCPINQDRLIIHYVILPSVPSRRSTDDPRIDSNWRRRAGSYPNRYCHPAPQREEEARRRILTPDRYRPATDNIQFDPV